jgi:uncharacterized protein (DUF362 family)
MNKQADTDQNGGASQAGGPARRGGTARKDGGSVSSSHEQGDRGDGVSRRQFLQRTGGTLLTAAAATGLGIWLYDESGKAGLRQPTPARLKNFFADVDYPAGDARLSVAHNAENDVDRMLAAALDGLGGIARFIKPGDHVLIKPNVGFERDPRMGATTNPEVLRRLIEMCYEDGKAGTVTVADNPIEQASACFARTQIQAVSSAAGAKVVLPASAQFKPIAVRDRKPDLALNEALGTWSIFWKPLEEADKVIGIAPIKDHNLCQGSMIMKNWYGLLGGRRNQFHQAIHNIVSDLGYMMSPSLVIADGTRVLMRNGPTGGSLDDVRAGQTIVAAVDQLACDAWCYEHLLHRDPQQLRYLDLAYEKFGGRNYEETRRFGERDWRVYHNQGKIVEQNV